MGADDAGQIYWHRDLPPLDAEPIGEQIVEATSCRVAGTLAYRGELWNQCYEDLKAQARICARVSCCSRTSNWVMKELVGVANG